MILICISLITNEVEHHLVFVLATRASSSVDCLSLSFASFSTGLFIVFLLIYWSSIQCLDTTPMSGIHKSMVVSFSFEKREEDSFHEL